MVSPRLSQTGRKVAIIQAVRSLLAEKGIKGVTSRELAEAAGISEALLFRHFTNKEALYAEVQLAVIEEDSESTPPFEAFPNCTETLVFMTGFMLLQAVCGELPGGRHQDFRRLVLTSLIEGGDFARQAMQGKPTRVIRKLADCLEAAIQVGDAIPGLATPWAVGWFTHYVGTMLIAHLSPDEPLVDFKVPANELAHQAQWFCLRGMGLKDEAILRCLNGPPPNTLPMDLPTPG